MSPEQINQRLAEAMGWHESRNNYMGPGAEFHSKDDWTPYTDLNQAAMVATKLGSWRLISDGHDYFRAWAGGFPRFMGYSNTSSSALCLAIVSFLEAQNGHL